MTLLGQTTTSHPDQQSPPFTPKQLTDLSFDSFEELLAPQASQETALSPLMRSLAYELQHHQQPLQQLEDPFMSLLLGNPTKDKSAGRRRSTSLYDMTSPQLSFSNFEVPPQHQRPPQQRRATINEGFGYENDLCTSLDDLETIKKSKKPKKDVTVFPPVEYTCEHEGCGKKFDRYHNLKSHVKSHSIERPYLCATCGLRFSRNHDLKRHERIHVGVRPYVCEYCDKSFLRLDALNRHLKVNNGRGCRSRVKRSELGTLSEEKFM